MSDTKTEIKTRKKRPRRPGLVHLRNALAEIRLAISDIETQRHKRLLLLALKAMTAITEDWLDLPTQKKVGNEDHSPTA